jgi:hypothetical protein
VADEGAGAIGAPEQAEDTARRPVGSGPTEPGWYPAGTNPNEQAYWDGEGWARRRRWTAAGWVEEDVSPVATVAATGTVAPPRYSANPYAAVTTPAMAAAHPPTSSRSSTSSSNLTVGLFVLLICGVLLLVGSDMSWVTASASFGGHSVTSHIPGLSVTYNVNGYAVFICGIVLVALSAALMANDDWQLRLLSLVTAWASLGFAIYFLVRILQDINDNTSALAHADVGGGLIVVMIAAVVAAAVTALRMR